jgi:hypothetical protein
VISCFYYGMTAGCIVTALLFWQPARSFSFRAGCYT